LSGPLEGILVVDLSRVLAGPYCTMMLGDLGADVIKIESPEGDDTRQWGPPYAGGESAYYLCANRNKKSVVLDLKNDGARQVLLDLVRRADILVENFRVGTMQRWGLDYQRLREVNPRLIYAAITGYGQTGPYSSRAGYDFIAQAEGGLMSIIGDTDGQPMKVGVAIVDISAGLFTATAILAALHEREKSGEGQYVDVALLDSQVAWLANVASNYLISGQRPERYGNAHANIVPYETFKTQDGYIAIGVGNDRQWQRFCEVLGESEWAAEARFATNPKRVENRTVLLAMINAVTLRRDRAAWCRLLQEAGVPCGPINSIDQVFSDAQVLHREMEVEIPHPTAGKVKLAGFPYKLSRTPAAISLHPPLLGEHTETVLRDLLGYSPEQITDLYAERMIKETG
jgi:formyl-CoA transferase